MSKKPNKFFEKNKNISEKLNILKIIFHKIAGENNIFSLINNFTEIKNLLEEKDPEILKFLYYVRENINNVLYSEDKVINIDKNKCNGFGDWFYLSLLVNYNANIINYTYNFDLIEKLFDLNKKINNKIIQKLFCKINSTLIDNFKNSDIYDEEQHEKKIESIELFYIKINEINNAENYALNSENINFEIQNIEKILSKIIINILEKLTEFVKSEEFESLKNILMLLDLEKIDITEKMCEEIFQFLNSDVFNLAEKKIRKIGDLYKKDNINFFFILLKYILKNPIYLYINPYLFKIRKTILSFIKSNKNLSRELNGLVDNNLKERFNYVIKKFVDSNYYYNQYKIKITNNEISSGNNAINLTNTQNQTLAQENINNQIIEKKQNYKYNDKNVKNIIKDLFSNKYNKIQDIIDELINIKKNIMNPDRIEYINFIKLIKSLKQLNEKIINEFVENKLRNNNDINDIIIKLLIEDKINKNDIYNINCEYKYKNFIYKDWNVLINGFNEGLEALLCDIKYS